MYYFGFFYLLYSLFFHIACALVCDSIVRAQVAEWRKPPQVRNVDNEYVELSNLQQPRSVCPQGPNTRQHKNLTHAQQEREGTPIKQCKFKWVDSQNCEKRLLAWSCLSVCPSASVFMSLCLSACPSVHMQQLGFQRKDFREI